MKLDFLLAGVQRSGSSTVWKYLFDHPQLRLPSCKECHFFDDETLDWRRPDYEILHAKLEPKPGALLNGEATPITLYWTPAHYRILAYNPDMKFIFVFRDPIERAFSGWRMVYQRGVERLPFSKTIREGRLRVLAEVEQPNFSRIYSHVERGMYARQLKALMKLFPIDNMLFLRTMDLQTSPRSALNSISRFLEISPFPETEPIHANLLSPGEFPSALTDEDCQYLATLFRDDLMEFASLTGLDVSEWRTMKYQRRQY